MNGYPLKNIYIYVYLKKKRIYKYLHKAKLCFDYCEQRLLNDLCVNRNRTISLITFISSTELFSLNRYPLKAKTAS